MHYIYILYACCVVQAPHELFPSLHGVENAARARKSQFERVDVGIPCNATKLELLPHSTRQLTARAEDKVTK